MKNTITKTFLMVLLAVSGMAKGQQWTELHTGLTDKMNDICCIDEDRVLVCGNNGLIAKTTDGGLTWARKNSPTTEHLYLMRFADDRVGFACGDNVLLKTVDGGETWNNLENINDLCIDYWNLDSKTNLFLLDADTLYLSDCRNIVWKSIDGGGSFSQIINLQEYDWDYWKMEMFFDDNLGYLIGHSNGYVFTDLVVFETVDFGQTWEPHIFDFQEFELECIHTIHFTDKKHIRIFGCFQDNLYHDYYSVIETNDGFESCFALLPSNYGCIFYDEDLWDNTRGMAFSSENDGCFFMNIDPIKTNENAHDCYVAVTSDNGNAWTTFLEGLNHNRYLYSIDAKGSTYYIAASNGIVYKTRLSETSLNETETSVEVFPNPTQDKVSIKIDSLDEHVTYSLELIGIDGRVVMKETISGNNATLDMGDLPSGVYVLSVKGNRVLHRQTIVKTE